MKKLIIAAAIVCVAAVSQAAAIQWMAMGIKGVDKNVYSGAATITFWLEADGSYETYAATCTAGNIMGAIAGDTDTTVDKGFINGGKVYSAQFTMTDADGNIYTSEKKTGITATFPSKNTIVFSSGSWQTVPEPTSGLLLLLGVAGLALRRRRA